jgi:hypothetical protein
MIPLLAERNPSRTPFLLRERPAWVEAASILGLLMVVPPWASDTAILCPSFVLLRYPLLRLVKRGRERPARRSRRSKCGAQESLPPTFYPVSDPLHALFLCI